MEKPIDNAISNEDKNMKFIRNVLRDELTFMRKQKRDENMNKSRLALGEEANINVYTKEFVAEAAKNLKKKSLRIEEYKKLQNALIQSEDHINAFFKIDNAIQGLSRDLSGTSTQSKLAAANCCCNLALGNSKACAALCKFTAPYLVAELESTSEPLAEICAWTIGNLVSESDKAFAILHAQDCLKSLIKLAEMCSITLLPAVSYASLRYIYKQVNSIESEDIVKLSQIMATRYPSVSDVDTMWLLAVLSSIPKCTVHLMNCVSFVCYYFLEAVFKEDESVAEISAALRIICNTVSESSGQVAHYLFSNESEKNRAFLDKILSHSYIHIRQEALWLLGNLCNHSSDTVQQLVRPLIVDLPSLKLALSTFNEEK